jgi:ATP/maltotriose-dependent transcriptional regulator MalT
MLGNDPNRAQEAIEILSQPIVAGEDMIGVRAMLVRHLETQTIYDRTGLQLKVLANMTDTAAAETLLKEVEQAVTTIEHRLGDRNPETLKLRGELRLVKNEPVEAIQDLNQAMTLMQQHGQPRDYPMMFNLARAYASTSPSYSEPSGRPVRSHW